MLKKKYMSAMFIALSLNAPAIASAQGRFAVSGSGMWTMGKSAQGLGEATGRVCYLQYITGRLSSGQALAGTTVRNGSWYLTGDAAPPDGDFSAGAYCINPGTNFGTVDGGWHQGQPDVALGATGDRVCFLYAVGGKFEGSGESVYVRPSGGMWYLGGTSKQRGVTARALCIVRPGINYGPIQNWRQGMGRINLSNQANVACFLTGLSGKFAGGGEQIFVDVDNGRWTLGGSSSQQGVSASAVCALF